MAACGWVGKLILSCPGFESNEIIQFYHNEFTSRLCCTFPCLTLPLPWGRAPGGNTSTCTDTSSSETARNGRHVMINTRWTLGNSEQLRLYTHGGLTLLINILMGEKKLYELWVHGQKRPKTQWANCLIYTYKTLTTCIQNKYKMIEAHPFNTLTKSNYENVECIYKIDLKLGG